LTVTFETRGNVAVALVDRPPVNAIDAAVRAGLLDAVRRAGADPAVAALVVACRGRTFMSGADLSELGSDIAAPPYAEVLRALEDFDRPVIAAMHGTPMGGGLEIAMACHYRCATAGTRLAMPEITLGILPGAGGTQRLPRLVGLDGALDLLLGGAPIDATRARELGLDYACLGIVANWAAGAGPDPDETITLDDVLANVAAATADVGRLLGALLAG